MCQLRMDDGVSTISGSDVKTNSHKWWRRLESVWNLVFNAVVNGEEDVEEEEEEEDEDEEEEDAG